RGELLFRQMGTHGVAANADGEVVVATADRVLGFHGGEASARWLRDHDGLQLGPALTRRDGVLVVACQGRGAVGLSAITGRELWRLIPPRTRRCWISVQAHRALIADDTGHLYGLDLESGQIRFRMRAALPYTGPTVPWGRRMLATIGRGDHSSLLAADAHAGALLWSHELANGAISRPLVLSRRVFVAHGDGREGRLMCLGSNGRPLWERHIHLGEPPWSLAEAAGNVIVWARNGAAGAFSVDGTPEWRLGAAGAELPATLTPCSSRGVLIVPGEVTRAVDPRGGRVLAELRTGLGLSDLVADSRLNVYALDEDGTFTAWKLSTSFAVV
ncbi:MAG: PQQ-binding-like beta-propeller repeat protein, partial [Myxococcaceae bacterium]